MKQFWVGMLVASMSMATLMILMQAPKTHRDLYGTPEVSENIVTEAVSGHDY